MRIIEIIEKYLRENGFDGLCDEGCEGGCGIDKIDDCAVNCALCEPAYRWDCECCSEANYCFSHTMGATNSCYRTTKQEREAALAESDTRDCNDCQYEPGDCLFCSDVTKNMFKPQTNLEGGYLNDCTKEGQERL
jgi:hypothetical protein